jgi:hypothetical protein
MMMEHKGDLTPTFGEIVDRFRELYSIYISATPTSNDDIIVYKFRYEVFKLSGNNIKNQYTGSEQAYYIAMREAILKAFELIEK